MNVMTGKGNGVLEMGNLIGLLFVMRMNTMSCSLNLDTLSTLSYAWKYNKWYL